MQDSRENRRSYKAGHRLKSHIGGASCKSISLPDEDDHHRTLVRWSLSLRPEERLAVLQDFVD
jgi:hypothetical protein